MTVCAQPAMSLGHSARVAEAMTLSDSAFRKRYRSSYETPSPSPSPTLPVQKRYRERERLEDKSPGLEGMEEKVVPEGQQQAVLATDTVMGEPLGLGYGALRCRELAVGEDQVPSTFEVGQSSSFTIILNRPITHSFASGYPAATMSIDENQFLEVGAQLELHGSIPHYHMQRLDALPPTLFEGYEKDLRELYTSAIWRSVLALEAWAGQTDAQRAALCHAIYDIQRENHNLRRQIAKERRERLELTDRVARMEMRFFIRSLYTIKLCSF
ncbi:hypothetical protein Tco_1526682, partial [Tanacetum coccineum]